MPIPAPPNRMDVSSVSARVLNQLVHCWIQAPATVSSSYQPLNAGSCTQMANSKKWMVLPIYNTNLDDVEYTYSLSVLQSRAPI